MHKLPRKDIWLRALATWEKRVLRKGNGGIALLPNAYAIPIWMTKTLGRIMKIVRINKNVSTVMLEYM